MKINLYKETFSNNCYIRF